MCVPRTIFFSRATHHTSTFLDDLGSFFSEVWGVPRTIFFSRGTPHTSAFFGNFGVFLGEEEVSPRDKKIVAERTPHHMFSLGWPLTSDALINLESFILGLFRSSYDFIALNIQAFWIWCYLSIGFLYYCTQWHPFSYGRNFSGLRNSVRYPTRAELDCGIPTGFGYLNGSELVPDSNDMGRSPARLCRGSPLT